MSRLLFFAILAVVGCKLLTGSWPWEMMQVKSSRSQARQKARRLLAVSADASRTEIVEAHKRLIATVHPDRGGSNAQVHEANAARDLLLNELPEGR